MVCRLTISCLVKISQNLNQNTNEDTEDVDFSIFDYKFVCHKF